MRRLPTERIGKMKDDTEVIKEYRRREQEFMERAADLEIVTKERDAAKRQFDDLRNQRLREFMEGFGIISMKLKEMYQVRFSPTSLFFSSRADYCRNTDDNAWW